MNRGRSPTKAQTKPELNSEDIDILDRSQNKLQNLDEIQALLRKGLLEVNLSVNLLSSPSGLPNTIKQLNLSMNRFSDMRGFNHLPNLSWLDISLNQLTSFEGIDLPNLIYLNASCNNLTKLKGIEKCRNLTTLIVSKNKLKTLSFSASNAKVVSPLKQLQHLMASENQLSEIAGSDIGPLASLRELDLSNNTLRSVNFLSVLSDIEVVNFSCNQLETFTLTKPSSLQWLYSLDVSGNRVTSVAGIEDCYPALTVLDVSRNKIEDDSSFESLIFMDSIAELYVSDNECFDSNTEDIWHERFDFLERINNRRFYSVCERERREMDKLYRDMKFTQLMTDAEINEISDEIKAMHQFDDELELDEPEGECDIVEHSIFKKNKHLGEEFTKNNEYLREFAASYQEQGEYLYSSYFEGLERASQKLHEYKVNINEEMSRATGKPAFKDEEMTKLEFKPKVVRAESAKNCSEPDTQVTDQSKFTPNTKESMKALDEDENTDRNSLFETKPKTSGVKVEAKKSSFRVRTYSRDLDQSLRRSDASSSQAGHKKLNINWAQKDLKKQNEEILRLLERTRKDLGPLQRVPARALKNVPSANRLGG